MSKHAIAARVAAVIVALVAGAASFSHIADVAMAAGERPWVAYSLPLAIDGLIVVGVAALLEDARHGRHGRWSGRLAVLVGVVATLAANVASAEPHLTARLVAIAAPVSFLLSIEVLTRTGRPRKDAATSGNAVRATESGEKPLTRTGARAKSLRKPTAERVAAAAARMSDPTPAKLAAKLGISERTVQRHWSPPAPETVSMNGGPSHD